MHADPLPQPPGQAAGRVGHRRMRGKGSVIAAEFVMNQPAHVGPREGVFADLHRKDTFARAYMGWLVHHEFGSDHRPFATHPSVPHAPGSLAWWLGQWVGVHRWLLAQ